MREAGNGRIKSFLDDWRIPFEIISRLESVSFRGVSHSAGLIWAVLLVAGELQAVRLRTKYTWTSGKSIKGRRLESEWSTPNDSPDKTPNKFTKISSVIANNLLVNRSVNDQ